MPALLLALPEAIARLAEAAEPWRSLYADSRVLPAVLNSAHVAGLLVGGGLALAADRQTLRVPSHAAAERGRQLRELAGLHRIVVLALAVVVASGTALFLADVEAFASSPWYWTKMGLVVLLVVNGALLARSERALRDDVAVTHAAAVPDGWRRLRRHAAVSAALWLAVTLAGVVLREG